VKWVTWRRIRVNRTATAWLIRRLFDRLATFLFVEAADIVRVADLPEDGCLAPEAAGLRAISEGFPLVGKYRRAHERDESIRELRAGLTWAFPVRTRS